MEALYLDDSYMNEFEAEIKSVDRERFVVLDKSGFYPDGGGQPHDTGKMIRLQDNEEFPVEYVRKSGGNISHEVTKPGLKTGDKVRCLIDWGRRYTLMRYHTAAHLISAVFHKDAQARITGNQLGLDHSRIDFNLENFDREKMDEYFSIANSIIDEDLPVSVSYMEREEAEKDSSLFKLVKALPESIKKLRIVSIGEYDRQADGGTHVKSLKEVGKIRFSKADNKGKNNRRVYFSLD